MLRSKFCSIMHVARMYSSGVAIPLKEAKHIKEMPGYTKFEQILAFMPGGKFHKKSLNEMFDIIKTEKGDMSFMPALLGQPNRIMLFNAEDIEAVFRNDGVWPHRGSFETLLYHRLKHRKDYFEDTVGLLPSNDEKWGKFRSAVNPILMHPKTVNNYIDRISKVSEEFVERIKKIRDRKTLEVPDNFAEVIKSFALESVTLIALDKNLGLLTEHQNEDALQFFDHLNNFFELFVELEMKLPIWKFINTKKFDEMMVAYDGITDFVDKYMQDAMRGIKTSSTSEKADAEKSVLEQLYKIDPKIASVMAMDMLFGGVDTTTTFFVSILLCLSRFPEKQEKLREEIFKILPEKNTPLTEQNMKNLPYLRACLKEAVRVYPVSSGILRTTGKDIVLRGYHIPKGTDISLINSYLVNDPQYYPRPSEFLPERWLREGSSPDISHKNAHPFSYFPFGFGARSCVGKRIVNLELEIGIAMLIRNFSVEFHYPTDNIFKCSLINSPDKPLNFVFKDL